MKTNSLVCSQIDYLKILAKSKNKLRRVILEKADQKLITAICECILNLLNGKIKIDSSSKEKLFKYRKTLRKLVNKSNLKEKKKILIQKGGFLEFLIPAAISTIGTIIESADKF